MDAVWLTVMGSLLYKSTLGNILLPALNAPPGLAFYLIYPIGILIFAALPARNADSVVPALIYGALFGAVTYATYDLTNYATLQNCTLLITVADIAWGAIATAAAAAAGYYLTKAIRSWLGLAER